MHWGCSPNVCLLNISLWASLFICEQAYHIFWFTSGVVGEWKERKTGAGKRGGGTPMDFPWAWRGSIGVSWSPSGRNLQGVARAGGDEAGNAEEGFVLFFCLCNLKRGTWSCTPVTFCIAIWRPLQLFSINSVSHNTNPPISEVDRFNHLGEYH